jgi:hypothetical protein
MGLDIAATVPKTSLIERFVAEDPKPKSLVSAFS